ncbi:MAG: nucleotide exchange factor GrpE [Candidatus Magasanikbacteria bacterium RIFOXYC2_FULL_42_28]|uniref:Protein GrpE n=1 Tax=Candidatus Magasanikbacteria bacterium RIFOXYC2_FULL_42_28 TaxID=1798704 RepID=A0A1F6NX24_9BACT|nr:MAG: nucleotide exchange factor GrpE [Candidatus Magasanikbacteria bacterium RIFOXYC2_FULL_42_28]
MSDEPKIEKDEEQAEQIDIVQDEAVAEPEPIKKSFFHKKCQNCEGLEKERDEYKFGWQRALADYKNLQTETEKRRGEWVRMSEAQILEEFIPVYDNFKKAFAVSGSLPLPEGEIKRGWESWAQGIEYIKKQFGDVLSAHGVEEIKTVGEKFDPTKHEAVGDEEIEDKEHGEILREVDGGYIIGGKVLKVARVIITK